MTLDLARLLWKGDLAARNDATLLFSESASRLLVTVSPDKSDEFEAIMADTGCSAIGVVTLAAELTIAGVNGAVVVTSGLAELKEAWQATLREL